MSHAMLDPMNDKEDRFVSLFDRSRGSNSGPERVRLLSTGKTHASWRGVALPKEALTLAMLTAMLQEIRPCTIFDLGMGEGDSAMCLADLCRALEIETKIVTVDDEDRRTDAVRERMRTNPTIQFLLGDLAKPDLALPPEMLATLPHPWLVLEHLDVPPFAVLTHLHLNGLEDGDYFVYEGLFRDESRKKRIALAMCTYSIEYKVDTRYSDMFGCNATTMPNAVFRRVEPEENARIVEFDTYEEISPAEMHRYLAEEGHVVLRPRGTIDEIPHALLPQLLGLSQHNLYEQGSEVRAATKDPRYLEVTRFPAHLWIPPHHELYYTLKPPARVAFICLTPPRIAGETTLYDGRKAYAFLSSSLKKRCASKKVRWRRRLGPPGEVHALENTSWARVFRASTFEEALQCARAEGYSLSMIDERAQIMVIEHFVPMTRGDCLVTSVVGNHPWIYETYFENAETSYDEPVWEDGTRFVEDELIELLEAYARARVQARWTRRGEVVMVNNDFMAHGRQPWSGPKREVQVVLGS